MAAGRGPGETGPTVRTVPLAHDGRFAPSPTGDLHLGNLRTALLAWLFARAARARFLMRVEDLDTGRVRAGIEARQLTDLRRLGLTWDGAVVRQSERTALYAQSLAQLEGDGLTYPCWCSRAEIRAAASAPHESDDGAEGRYPGTCHALSSSARRERERSGRPAAVRVRAGGARIAFTDRLAGPQTGVVDDFVVRRNDGAFAYNLAVAVDDADQGVGEVVRGADLLSCTPRQLWLLERLGLRSPAYAHVPLLLGDDGQRLAKRNEGQTLSQRMAAGDGVDAVRTELAASAGLVEAATQPVSLAALLDGFDPSRLTATPSR